MPPFPAQVAMAVLGTLLFVLWSRNQWGGERATVAFAVIVSAIVPMAAGWACWRRASVSSPDLRTAWRLIGASTIAWGLGQCYWAWFELTTGRPPDVPSPADIGYLALVPLATIGVTALVRRQGPGLDPRPLLDGAIVGSSFIFIAFALGLERIVVESEATDVALIVNLLYPFGDGVVLGVALLRLSRAPVQARGAMGFLTAGFIMLAVADLWFLVVDAQGIYSTGGILDAFWILGFQLIGLAAVRPGNLETTVDAPPQTRWLALVPLYPFLAAMVVSAVTELRVGYFSDTLFWTALVVIILVVSRLVLMLFDNFRLTERIQEAQALRTQMLNNVTHDLLSPLSAVRIQLKLLEGNTFGAKSPAQEHALQIVHRNVERVGRLGADLKDVANMEGHGIALIPAPFDLAAEVRRAVSTFEPEAQQRGVHLVAEAPGAAPAVGDAGRIGQVLDNLLSNALKFTPSGGRVAVRLAGGNPAWHLSVADTGRGLAPGEMDRLFRPFSQVHKPGEVKERGTGLGLYISRGIVERHGGALTVSSPGLGRGSTFHVELPLATAPKAEAAHGPS